MSISQILRLKKAKPDTTPKQTGKCGRKKKVNQRTEKKIASTIMKDQRITSCQIANELRDGGTDVSASTICKVSIENDLSAH